MKIHEVIESLQRFPQDAEVRISDKGITIFLFGYVKEDDNEQPKVPTYQLDAPTESLPWIWDENWLENHKMKEKQHGP